MNLPKLPNSKYLGNDTGYTAKQMRDYATKVAQLAVKEDRRKLVLELKKQPLNDTAHSIAVWITEQP